MKILPHRYILAALAFTLFTPLAVRSEALLNDASSATWYLAGTSGGGTLTVSTETERMTYTSAGSTANIIGYFDAYSLSLGGTVTLSMNVTLSSTPAVRQGIRFGLFNSGGDRIDADTSGFTNSLFESYEGYSVWFNPTDGGNTYQNSYNVYKRIGDNTAIFASASAVNPYLGDDHGAVVGLEANVSELWQLSLTRTESGVTIVSSVNGVVVERSDIDAPYFSFDTLAIQFSSTVPGDGGSVIFDNITIIPESSSSALLLGAAGLLILLRARRRIR